MKLELTLPERPGFLHALPVLDLFALLWLLFLLAPSLLRQSGVEVELPPSRFQLERYQNSMVITLRPGENGPVIHLGREMVTRDELMARLDALREKGEDRTSMVLLQSDLGTAVEAERAITEMVLEKGFRLALVGANTPPSAPAKESTDPE
jgi:biopolymer transport protein ExbD